MITFCRQMWITLHTGEWFLFEIYVLFVWAVMLPRMICAWRFYYLFKQRRVQHYPEGRCAVSALVTVYREDREDLVRCLSSLSRALQHGAARHEILVVVDGLRKGETSDEVDIACQYADLVLTTNARNKRRNLRALVRQAQNDLLLLVDSDTFFEQDTVRELLRPFADAGIGGATTAQLIYRPRAIMQRISFWLESARLNSSMAASSLYRQVACLPGRAYAVRRALVEPHLDALVEERFGTRRCIAGDDRFITNVILRSGSRTVLVPTARVTTLAPVSFAKTSRMWLRWGRSSQRYTLQSPWLFRYRFAAFVYWGDILLCIATSFIVVVHWPYRVLFGTMDQALWEMAVFAFTGMLLTASVRQVPHLLRYPRYWLLLPVFVVVVTYLQLLRLYAMATIHKVDRWGTRDGSDARSEDGIHVTPAKDTRPSHSPLPHANYGLRGSQNRTCDATGDVSRAEASRVEVNLACELGRDRPGPHELEPDGVCSGCRSALKARRVAEGRNDTYLWPG